MHVRDCSCASILQFSMRRQMAPQQSAKFRTAVFGQLCTSLRKDSVANYAWIWTLFSPSIKRSRCALQHTRGFVVPLAGGTTRFANLRQKFSKMQKICRRVVPNTSYGYYWDSYKLHTRNACSVAISCQYAWNDAFVSSLIWCCSVV